MTLLPRSLLGRTLAAVAGVSAVLLLLTTGYLVWSAREEALEAQDAHLIDMTAALARADVATVLPRALTMDPAQFAERLESDEPLPRMRGRHGGRHGMMGMMGMEPESERRTLIPAGEPLLVRLIEKGGQAVVTRLEKDVTAGLTTLSIESAPYRVFLLFLPNGRYTAVGESMALREAVVFDRAVTAATPLLVSLPILLLAVTLVLWRALKPLKTAAEDVRKRSAADLDALPTSDVPAEIRPFVEAVNALLARVSEARKRELRFTADAAHELRSPLTSLTIEAEHLKRLHLSPEARTIVDNLEQGLERSVRQVSQLLLFARAQAGESRAALLRDAEPWFLSELVGEVVEPLLSVMERKAIRFEAEGLDDASATPVTGLSRAAVQAILRNLTENALHYTPAKGAVTLAVRRTPEALSLTVSDTGPGIPPAERERVFDPFYRIVGTNLPGTGLGLAIVKTYAGMLGADVTLADAHPAGTPPGLAVTVRIPLANAA